MPQNKALHCVYCTIIYNTNRLVIKRFNTRKVTVQLGGLCVNSAVKVRQLVSFHKPPFCVWLRSDLKFLSSGSLEEDVTQWVFTFLICLSCLRPSPTDTALCGYLGLSGCIVSENAHFNILQKAS